MVKLGICKPAHVSIPLEGSSRIKLPFGLVETISAEDERKIARRACDGILLCEAGRLTYMAWLKSHGRVSQKRGPIWASGTFEELNGLGGSDTWYAEKWRLYGAPNEDDGASFSLPTWENLHDFPGGREDTEIKRLEREYGHDLFMERCGAVPMRSRTLVFSEFSHTSHVINITTNLNCNRLDWISEDNHIVGVEIPENTKFYLAIDPGYAGAYAVLLIAIIDGKVFVHDEVYEQRMTGRAVINLCRSKWGSIWNKIQSGVIDVAGRQHPGSESQIEIWAEAGIGLDSEYIPLRDSIERHRSFLALDNGVPRMFINSRCKNTIREYGLWKYKRVEDASAAIKTVREEPISAANHALSALSYFLVNKFGHIERKTREEYLYKSPTSWTKTTQQEENWLPFELR